MVQREELEVTPLIDSDDSHGVVNDGCTSYDVIDDRKSKKTSTDEAANVVGNRTQNGYCKQVLIYINVLVAKSEVVIMCLIHYFWVTLDD